MINKSEFLVHLKNINGSIDSERVNAVDFYTQHGMVLFVGSRNEITGHPEKVAAFPQDNVTLIKKL